MTTKENFEKLSDKEKCEILKKALIDVLDGNAAPWDIKYFTGLPDDRCHEIFNLFNIISS